MLRTDGQACTVGHLRVIVEQVAPVRVKNEVTGRRTELILRVWRVLISAQRVEIVVKVVFRLVWVVVFVRINATNASLKVSDYVVRVRDQSQCDLFADEPEELDLLVPIAAQAPPIGAGDHLVSFVARKVSWIFDRKFNVVVLATGKEREKF